MAGFTAVMPSLVSQVLFITGNELIGSSRTGIFINLVPIFATILSVMILGERMQVYHVVALGLVLVLVLVLVLGGIWWAERGG
ncbi:EamA family transporter [Hoeflea marina]|uniref:EamA family transporter n=1 Tax=Hoeflea marina TaxID=274592 RepID=UPI001FE08A26|nr:EamA family transporter [Hoeflea marina]